MRGSAIFRVQPAQGTVLRPVRKLRAAGQAIRPILLAEMRRAEPRLLEVFQSFAPYDADERDDTHLREELDAKLATGGRIRITVESPVRDPRSGYAYTGVTRFGHRGRLVARSGGFLRWEDASGWHIARSTAGHHPASDWVEDARPSAEDVASDAAERAGRVVYTRLL
jgi:hypothetical protein